jgi:glucose-6-phosphate 1-dehydrogenase
VRDEKLKVIRALDPVEPHHIVRGQYAPANGAGGGLSARMWATRDSRTESFVALKVHVANWRWKGTPFYLRTGKRLRARASEIAVTFKRPAAFDLRRGASAGAQRAGHPAAAERGHHAAVMIKEPGPGGMRLVDVPLDMSFAEALGEDGARSPTPTSG